MTNLNNEKWFECWFNSPYYHILYRDRNETEAENFISNIFHFLNPDKESKILDLACGKGRHSIFMNMLGYTVTGLDLSRNSIGEAKKHENSTLNFGVHDMRDVFKSNHFDLILNLFTSFGYFETDGDNLKTLNSVNKQLAKDGVFILDYLNVHHVEQNLIPQEHKIIDQIEFNLSKIIDHGFIKKKIEIKDGDITLNFEEKVRFLTFEKLKEYFFISNLEVIHTFGDYLLNPFDQFNSNRLILIGKKNKIGKIKN